MSRHIYRFLGSPGKIEQNWEIKDLEECHHLLKVLRLDAGKTIEVADGQGAVGTGVITSVNPKCITVKLNSSPKIFPPQNRIDLCLGALKASVFDEILPDLVELGADNIFLFKSDQVEDHRISEKALLRWQKIVRTAFKQCKRPYLPNIFTDQNLAAVLNRFNSGYANKFVCAAEATESLLSTTFFTGNSVLLVGAEAGLTADEAQLAKKMGFKAVSLGRHILRARTAAPIGVAIASLKASQS